MYVTMVAMQLRSRKDSGKEQLHKIVARKHHTKSHEDNILSLRICTFKSSKRTTFLVRST